VSGVRYGSHVKNRPQNKMIGTRRCFSRNLRKPSGMWNLRRGPPTPRASAPQKTLG
jgi:hypothetical protein